MDWLSQWLLINVAFFALFIFLARAVWRSRRREADALAQKLRPGASARGWQVTSELRKDNVRVIRWSGREFDVQWIAEDLYRKRGQHPNRAVLELTRWQTVDHRGPAGTIVLMGFPEGTELPKAQAVEGFLQSLAVKAAFFALDKALDMYFGEDAGKEIDASALSRVEEVEPFVTGFAVFAENPDEAARVIRAGVDRAIAATIAHEPETLGGSRRPWILIWTRGVVIARVGQTRSAAEVVPFVNAGVAIARAVTKR